MKHTNAISSEEARQFFLSRLQSQAAAEGSPLTKIEIEYLDYSRTKTDEEADSVEAAFDAKFDNDEFADRIERLTRDAVKQDSASDPKAPARYKEYLHALAGSPDNGQLRSFVAPGLGGGVTGPFSGARSGFWLALGAVGMIGLLLILWDAFVHR